MASKKESRRKPARAQRSANEASSMERLEASPARRGSSRAAAKESLKGQKLPRAKVTSKKKSTHSSKTSWPLMKRKQLGNGVRSSAGRNVSSATSPDVRRRKMKARVLMQQGNSVDGFISQVRQPGQSWGKDWGTANRALECHQAMEKFIAKHPPNFILAIHAGSNSSRAGLKRMLRQFRNRYDSFYSHKQFPRRKDRRKPEYIAAFEIGAHPRVAREPLPHLHVLLYNVSGADAQRMRKAWCWVAAINSKGSGCRVRKFKSAREGGGYGLKTWGTAADDIEISPKLSRAMLCGE
jgi:hypothetical protein